MMLNFTVISNSPIVRNLSAKTSVRHKDFEFVIPEIFYRESLVLRGIQYYLRSPISLGGCGDSGWDFGDDIKERLLTSNSRCQK